MSGTNLQRVHYVNANWTPSPSGDVNAPEGGLDLDGADDPGKKFCLLVVTEDGRHHELHVSADEAGPLIQLTQVSNALLWDPENLSLIAANLVGQSVQDTVTPTPPAGVPELADTTEAS